MLINKGMKIKDIVTEYVEQGQAQANKTSLDNEVVKKKERDIKKEQGIDPELEEISQDLPV